MLITELITDEYLGVQCNYSTDYVDRLRKIPGSRFDRSNKRWIIPLGAVDYFEKDFRGEIIWKTPRWVVFKEPMPDLSKMYYVDPSVQVPALKLQPYDYQKHGIRFMIDRLNTDGFVINADDVGLGKTPQAIGTMKHFADNSKVNRILIACKKSLKRQWCAEIKKFSDLDATMHIDFVEGTKAHRQKIYKEFAKHPRGILVMNYQTVMNDTAYLALMGFQMIIIDEAHCVKARTGVMNSALTTLGLKAKYKVFLTGTPIMSKPDDIYGVVQIATKNYFGKWEDFDKKHIKSEFNGRFKKTVGYMELDDLRAQVQHIVIRRTEFEVSVDLPDTIIKRIDCTIDGIQVAMQDKIKEERNEILIKLDKLKKKPNKTPQDTSAILGFEGMIKGLVAAQQAVANDPRLFELSKSKSMIKTYVPMIPTSYDCSDKTETCLELIQDITDAGQKVIVFSKFERSVQLLQARIENKLKLETAIYTGQIDDQTRELNVERFKHSTSCNVMIGTDAMAEGLNLQVSNHCINFDQPDTPAIKTQRTGRCRRVSSTYDHVYVYDLITEDSKDVERIENIERISGLFDGLVNVNSAQSIALKQAIANEN